VTLPKHEPAMTTLACRGRELHLLPLLFGAVFIGGPWGAAFERTETEPSPLADSRKEAGRVEKTQCADANLLVSHQKTR
jgi:hypothetical protein